MSVKNWKLFSIWWRYDKNELVSDEQVNYQYLWLNWNLGGLLCVPRSRTAYLQVGEASESAATTSAVASRPIRQPMGRGKMLLMNTTWEHTMIVTSCYSWCPSFHFVNRLCNLEVSTDEISVSSVSVACTPCPQKRPTLSFFISSLNINRF